MLHNVKRYNLRLYVLLLILAAGVISLFVARGFYYTSFQSSFVITIGGPDADYLVNQLATKSNVAKVDRENKQVYLQNLTLNQFTERLNEIKELYKDYKDRVTYTTFELENLSVYTLNTNLTLSLLITATLAYYTYTKIIRKLDKQDRLKILAVLLLSLISGFVSALGFISLLSWITMINEYLLYSLAFAAVINLTIVYMAVHSYLPHQFSRVDAAIREIINTYSRKYKSILAAIVLSVGALAIGLGSKYALEGIVLIVSLLIMQFNVSIVSRLWYGLITMDWNAVIGKSSWIIETEDIIDPTLPVSPDNIIENKSSKTKSATKKSKRRRR